MVTLLELDSKGRNFGFGKVRNFGREHVREKIVIPLSPASLSFNYIGQCSPTLQRRTSFRHPCQRLSIQLRPDNL